MDLTDLNEVSKKTKREEIYVFHPNNTQPNKNPAPVKPHPGKDSVPERGDGPHLPHSLSVVNIKTKVISGGKQVAVVLKNLMAAPVTITKGIKFTQVVAVNAVSPVEVAPWTLEKLVEIQGRL